MQLADVCVLCSIQGIFYMSHDYGEPNFHKIVKNEQSGTRILANSCKYNLASDICGES